jgi:2-polyprenyl-3-methyl-5-hydroxy-6-metoxy-1,4-benzoquinol methylase
VVTGVSIAQRSLHLARRAARPLLRTAYRFKMRGSARLLRAGDEGTRLRKLFDRGLWHVDSIRAEGRDLHIDGWALTSRQAPAQLTLRINGEPVSSANFGRRRPDLAAIYNYVPHAGTCGFSARLPFHQVRTAELRIELCHAQGPVEGMPPFYARLDRIDDIPLPDPDRMRRVHGDSNPVAFVTSGYNLFRQLEEARCRVVGAGFEPGLRLLDWGCGSGRIARWFALRPGVELSGVDVDADNVQWCATHLPVGTFRSIGLHPPTPFDAASFDLVIGVSIFTHLSEAVQFEWLRELRRILRPGGHALVSVHAEATTAQQSAWPITLLDRWEKAGFVDNESHDLDGYLPERGYYRTTHHHPAYIAREWSKVFPAVELLEGYLGNQALCVLRA